MQTGHHATGRSTRTGIHGRHSFRLGILPVVVLVASCGGGSDAFRSQGAAAGDGTPVRVAGWNIETVGAPGTAEYDAALAILNRIGADVVGISEVSSAADVGYFENLAAEAGYPHTVVASYTDFGYLRCAVMSRYPFASGPYVHDSAGLSGDPGANDITRLIVEAVIDLPDHPEDLTVVVNHWKSGTANEDEFRRAVESIRTGQPVADLDTFGDAFVILGDVNEERDSVPRSPNPFTELPSGLPAAYTLGADLGAEMAGPGLVNDPFHYLETHEPYTVALDAWQLDGTDATRPSSGRRLDYVFVSEILRNEAPETEVYDSADEGLPGGLIKYGAAPAASASADASDHLPVFADLLMAPAGCGSDAECDDGLNCNGLETCEAGTCQAGAPVDCSDGVLCTTDSCDEATGDCVHQPEDAICDNGLFCDGGEWCDPGLGCRPGTPPDCTGQAGECQAGACDEAADACSPVPLPDGSACDNGDACLGDTCLDGACEPLPCGIAPPTGLSGRFGSQVVLSWQPSQEPDLAGYGVYRGEQPGGPYVKIGEASARKISYRDKNPGDGLRCYVVTAFTATGQESSYSEEACGIAGR